MLRSQADDEECAGEKEDGGGGEGNQYVERAPNESDQEAGEKIADGIDGGERAEGHAVLLLRDNLGGEGIFKRFFGADVEPRKHENHRKQRKGTGSDAQENRSDTSQGVTSGEHSLAVRNVIAEPAACVSGARVKDVVKRVKSDGETCGVGESVGGRQHARGVENQKRVGEITGVEDAYAEKQAPEGWRQRP